MERAATLHSTIRAELLQRGPCALQALLDRLPQFSWSEVFTAIDRLSREGSLVLRHPWRFDYEVSVAQSWAMPEQPAEGSDAQGDAVRGRADVGSEVMEDMEEKINA
jgi:hypothetical protein